MNVTGCRNRVEFSAACGALLVGLLAGNPRGDDGNFGVTPVGSVKIPGGARCVAFLRINGSPYVVTGDSLLYLVDVRRPGSPSISAARTVDGGTIKGISAVSAKAYVAAGEAGFMVFDISNPGAFLPAGEIPLLGDVQSVAWTSTCVLIYHYPYLSAVDVGALLQPTVLGRCRVYARTSPIAVEGTHAYLTKRTSLPVVDFSNPSSPHNARTLAAPDTAVAVETNGDALFAALVGGAICVARLDGAHEPAAVPDLAVPSGRIAALRASGTHLYVVGSPGFLRIHDVSNPQTPEFVGSRNDPARRYRAVAVNGDRVYVAGDGELLILSSKPAGIAAKNVVPFNRRTVSSRACPVDLLGRRRGPAGTPSPRSTSRVAGIICTAGSGKTSNESEVRL